MRAVHWVCLYVFVCAGVYILIGAGALMMVVGFLGCCGAIQESPCMLGLVCTTFLSFMQLSLPILLTSFDFTYNLNCLTKSFFFTVQALSCCCDFTRQHVDSLCHWPSLKSMRLAASIILILFTEQYQGQRTAPWLPCTCCLPPSLPSSLALIFLY